MSDVSVRKVLLGVEEQVAWLTAHATATTVAELMRSSWRAVTAMLTRVVGEARGRTDRLEGLRKIAIDEKAYRKGHRYLTVVTDLDTGRVVWAAEGRCKAPNAVLCLDSFRVVAWAGEAVDEVRRRITRDLKGAGRGEDAKALKGSRWAVLKNPANLTGGQQEFLAVIKTTKRRDQHPGREHRRR